MGTGFEGFNKLLEEAEEAEAVELGGQELADSFQGFDDLLNEDPLQAQVSGALGGTGLQQRVRDPRDAKEIGQPFEGTHRDESRFTSSPFTTEDTGTPFRSHLSDDFAEMASANQHWTEQAYASVAQTLAGGLFEALEGLARIPDAIPGYREIYGEPSNKIAEVFAGLREHVHKTFPIHERTDVPPVFSWSTVGALGESLVGFGVPGSVIGKGVSLSAKLAGQGLAKYLPTRASSTAARAVAITDELLAGQKVLNALHMNTLNNVATTFGAGYLMNDVEGSLMAYEVYKQARESAVELYNQGEISADEVETAARMAGEGFKQQNKNLMYLNFLEMGGLMKLASRNAVRGAGAIRRAGKNIVTPNADNLLLQAGQEAFEETYQASYERVFGDLANSAMTDDEITRAAWENVGEPDVVYEGILGALGGAGQRVILNKFAGGRNESRQQLDALFHLQQQQQAKNEEFVNSGFKKGTQFYKAVEELHRRGAEPDAQMVEEMALLDLIHQNFKLGSTESLERTLTDWEHLTDEQAKDRGLSDVEAEAARQTAKRTKKKLREFEVEYNRAIASGKWVNPVSVATGRNKTKILQRRIDHQKLTTDSVKGDLEPHVTRAEEKSARLGHNFKYDYEDPYNPYHSRRERKKYDAFRRFKNSIESTEEFEAYNEEKERLEVWQLEMDSQTEQNQQRESKAGQEAAKETKEKVERIQEEETERARIRSEEEKKKRKKERGSVLSRVKKKFGKEEDEETEKETSKTPEERREETPPPDVEGTESESATTDRETVGEPSATEEQERKAERQDAETGVEVDESVASDEAPSSIPSSEVQDVDIEDTGTLGDTRKLIDQFEGEAEKQKEEADETLSQDEIDEETVEDPSAGADQDKDPDLAKHSGHVPQQEQQRLQDEDEAPVVTGVSSVALAYKRDASGDHNEHFSVWAENQRESFEERPVEVHVSTDVDPGSVEGFILEGIQNGDKITKKKGKWYLGGKEFDPANLPVRVTVLEEGTDQPLMFDAGTGDKVVSSFTWSANGLRKRFGSNPNVNVEARIAQVRAWKVAVYSKGITGKNRVFTRMTMTNGKFVGNELGAENTLEQVRQVFNLSDVVLGVVKGDHLISDAEGPIHDNPVFQYHKNPDGTVMTDDNGVPLDVFGTVFMMLEMPNGENFPLKLQQRNLTEEEATLVADLYLQGLMFGFTTKIGDTNVHPRNKPVVSNGKETKGITPAQALELYVYTFLDRNFHIDRNLDLDPKDRVVTIGSKEHRMPDFQSEETRKEIIKHLMDHKVRSVQERFLTNGTTGDRQASIGGTVEEPITLDGVEYKGDVDYLTWLTEGENPALTSDVLLDAGEGNLPYSGPFIHPGFYLSGDTTVDPSITGEVKPAVTQPIPDATFEVTQERKEATPLERKIVNRPTGSKAVLVDGSVTPVITFFGNNELMDINGNSYEISIVTDIIYPTESKIDSEGDEDLGDIFFKHFEVAEEPELSQLTDIQDELPWLRQRLPQIPEYIWEDLVEIAGRRSWGAFGGNVIHLARVGLEGRTYHEAFHAVFDSFLSAEQREQIYEEASKIYNIEIEEAVKSEVVAHEIDGATDISIYRTSAGELVYLSVEMGIGGGDVYLDYIGTIDEEAFASGVPLGELKPKVQAQRRNQLGNREVRKVFRTWLAEHGDVEHVNFFRLGRQQSDMSRLPVARFTDDVAERRLQIEEILAEEFRNTVLNRQVDESLTGKVKAFFRRLLRWVQRIYDKDYSIQQLFSDIDNGVFKYDKPTPSNGVKFLELDGFNHAELREIRRGMFFTAVRYSGLEFTKEGHKEAAERVPTIEHIGNLNLPAAFDALKKQISFLRSKKTNPVGWAKSTTEESYEVSSKGDARFSAFNAQLADGRIIEEIYQLDVKGYGVAKARKKGATAKQFKAYRKGKGKPPIRKLTRKQQYEEYRALWMQWATENPELIEELRIASEGKTLTDRFAGEGNSINQARALFDVLGEIASPQAEKLQTILDDESLKALFENEVVKMAKQLGVRDVTVEENIDESILDEEKREKGQNDIHDKSAYETSQKKRARASIRVILSSIPQMKMEEGKPQLIKGKHFGLPAFHTHSVMWNKLENTLSNNVATGESTEWNELERRLKQLASEDASINFMYNEIVLRMDMADRVRLALAFQTMNAEFETTLWGHQEAEVLDETGLASGESIKVGIQGRSFPSQGQERIRAVGQEWSSNLQRRKFQKKPQSLEGIITGFKELRVRAQQNLKKRVDTGNYLALMYTDIANQLSKIGVKVDPSHLQYLVSTVKGDLRPKQALWEWLDELIKVSVDPKEPGPNSLRGIKNIIEAQKKGAGVDLDLSKFANTPFRGNPFIELAEAVARVDGDANETTVVAERVKPRWVFTLPTYVGRQIARWKKSPSELAELEKDIFVNEASYWFQSQLRWSPKRKRFGRALSKLKLVSGLEQRELGSDHIGSTFTNTTNTDKKVFFISKILRGVAEKGKTAFKGTSSFPGLNPADKQIQYFYEGFTPISIVRGAGYDVKTGVINPRTITFSGAAVRVFRTHALGEMNRVSRVLDQIKKFPSHKLIQYYHARNVKKPKGMSVGEWKKQMMPGGSNVGNGLKLQLFNIFEYESIREVDKALASELYIQDVETKVWVTRKRLSDETKAKLDKYVEHFMRQIVEEEFAVMAEEGLVEKVEGGYTIPDTFIYDNILKMYMKPDRLTPAISKRHAQAKAAIDGLLNGFVGNVEQMLLFHGDWAFYKDVDDIGKRTPAILTDGLYLIRMKLGKLKNHVKANYKVIVLADEEFDSDYYTTRPFQNQITQILQEQWGFKGTVARRESANIVKAYKDINAADAQAYITLTRYREILDGFGRWTKKHEEAFKELSAGKTVSPWQLALFTQPQKGVHFGLQLQNDHRVPHYLKYSQAVLLPALVKGTPLEYLEARMTREGIGEAVFESGMKLGARAIVNLDEAISGKVEALHPIILRNRDWKLQVESPTKGIMQRLIGSQQRKNILAAVKNSFRINVNGREMTGRTWKKQINNLYSALSEIEREALNDRWDIVETEKGIQVNDEQAFIQEMYEEAVRSGVSDNVLDMLSVGKDSKIKVPFSGHPMRSKIENILLGVIRKFGVKNTSPGGSMVQMSPVGLTGIRGLSELKPEFQDYIRSKYPVLEPPRLTAKAPSTVGDLKFDAASIARIKSGDQIYTNRVNPLVNNGTYRIDADTLVQVTGKLYKTREELSVMEQQEWATGEGYKNLEDFYRNVPSEHVKQFIVGNESPLFIYRMEVVEEIKDLDLSTSMQGFTLHSGLAMGADRTWQSIGKTFGVKTKGYSFKGHEDSTQAKANQEGRVQLTQAELEEGYVHAAKANETLGRTFPPKSVHVKNLLARNWFQVKNADAVFAVAKGIVGQKEVLGGTGWAVQMAIDSNKPVNVYHEGLKRWFYWNYKKGQFSYNIGIPKLTENFAGIGTRDLTPSGKDAIQEIYENTLKIRQPHLTHQTVEFRPGHVLLPYWFKKHLPNDMFNDGKGGIDQKKVQDFFLENPKLAKIISYRIPGQAKFSIDAAQVVGFLPEMMGDTIVMFDETPAKTGSDFDFDKMFVMTPAFLVNKGKDGETQIKYINYDSADHPRAARRRHTRYVRRRVTKAENAEWNDAETKQKKDQLIRNYTEKYERLPSLEEFQKWSIARQNGKEAITNRIIEMYHAIFSHPGVYVHAVSPIGKIDLKKFADEIVTSEDKRQVPLRIFLTLGHQLRLNQTFTEAKGMTAQVANHITHHAVQEDNPVLVNGMHFGAIFDHNHENFIVDVLSAILDGSVDAAKDPYLFYLGMNRHTVSVGLALLRHDIPYKTVFRFLRQPIIKDYIKEKRKRDSRTLGIDEERSAFDVVMDRYMEKAVRASGGFEFAEDTSPEKLEAMRRAGVAVKKTSPEQLRAEYKKVSDEGTIEEADDISTQLLIIPQKTYEKYSKPDANRDVAFYADQVDMLDNYVKWEIQSQDLDMLVKASRADTQGAGSTLAEMFTMRNRVYEIIRHPDRFAGGERFFLDKVGNMTATYVKNSVFFSYNLFKEYFNELGPVGEGVIRGTAKLMGDFPAINSKKIQKIMTELNGYMVMEMLTSRGDVNLNQIEKLFKGKKNLARRLEKMREIEPDNMFLKWLVRKETDEDYSFVRGSTRQKAADHINDLVASWTELLTNTENPKVQKFARDLGIYSLITSGGRRGAYTFHDITTASPIFRDSVKMDDYYADNLRGYGTGLHMAPYIIPQIFAHNSEDTDFVPVITRKQLSSKNVRFHPDELYITAPQALRLNLIAGVVWKDEVSKLFELFAYKPFIRVANGNLYQVSEYDTGNGARYVRVSEIGYAEDGDRKLEYHPNLSYYPVLVPDRRATEVELDMAKANQIRITPTELVRDTPDNLSKETKKLPINDKKMLEDGDQNQRECE